MSSTSVNIVTRRWYIWIVTEVVYHLGNCFRFRLRSSRDGI